MSRVVLITGASRGIGAATARLAAERGEVAADRLRHAVPQRVAGDRVADGHLGEPGHAGGEGGQVGDRQVVAGVDVQPAFEGRVRRAAATLELDRRGLLDLMPVLTTWPLDGGPVITLPLVITRNP